MSVVAPVTTPLAKPFVQGLDGNRSPSPQGTKGKEAMEMDNDDLGHLQHSLEPDDIDDDLPHLTIERDVQGDKGKEAMGTHETFVVVNRIDESMEIDDGCLDPSINVEHLRDTTHTNPKPKRKQLNKTKSPGKERSNLKGGQAGAAIQAGKEQISQGEGVGLPAQRSKD